MGSEICAWEIEEARRLSKRIIPVLWQPVDFAKVHKTLRAINAVPFNDESAVGGLRKLIESIESDLDWLREHTRLGERAAEWTTANASAELLLRGSALKAVQQWVQSKPATAPDLTPMHLAYIRASEEEETRLINNELQRLKEIETAKEVAEAARSKAEAAQAIAEGAQQAAETARRNEASAARRTVQRTRLGLVAALLLTTAAGIAGWLAWTNQRAAETQAARVRDQLRSTEVTRARFLTNLSSQQLLEAGDLALAYLLAVEAFTGNQSEGIGEVVPEAQSAYLRAAMTLHEKRVIRHDIPIASNETKLIVDPALKWIASFSGSDVVLWDVARSEQIAELRGHTGQLQRGLFSPDGSTLFTEGGDGQRFWSVSERREVARIAAGGDSIRHWLLRELKPGRGLVLLSSKRIAHLDWRTGVITPIIDASGAFPSAAASADRSRAVIVDGERIITLSSESDKPIVNVEYKVSSGGWAVSPDARYVAIADGNQTSVDVVDARTGQRRQFGGHKAGIYQVAFVDAPDPNRDVVITASRDGSIRLRRIADGAEIGALTALAGTTPR